MQCNSQARLGLVVALAIALAFCGASARATTIGWWRLDDAGATDGGAVGTADNAQGNSQLDGTGSSGAKYTTDVPDAVIVDPVTGQRVTNTFALDATANNARVTVADFVGNPLDTAAFTVEMFLKLPDPNDLPTSFHSFARRNSGGKGWQIDYNAPTYSSGGTNPNAHKIRARFDPVGGSNKVTQGKLVNDGEWHHIALVTDGTIGRIYTDYQAGTSITLGSTLVNDFDLAFGKFASSGYPLIIDELRVTDRVLQPSEFLRAIPEPCTLSLLALGGLAAVLRRRRRA